MKKLIYFSILILPLTLTSQRLQRNSYIDIPSPDLEEGLFVNANGSFPFSPNLGYGFDPNFGIEFSKGGMDFGLNWYAGTDFVLDLAYQFHKVQNTALSFGIDNIAFSKYISTLGSDTTFADEIYEPRPPEAWSFYLAGSREFGRRFEVTAGLGRGKYIGYGPRSSLPNTDIFYSDKHENFALGLFLGTKFAINRWFNIILEADGRDINLGITSDFGMFTGEISVLKLENSLWESSDEVLTTRINANVSFRLPFFESKKKKDKWEPVISADKIYFDVDFEDIEVTGMVPQKIDGLEEQRTVTSEDYKPITPEAVKLFREASELFGIGEYDEARIKFEKALKGLGEYRPEALFRIGECYYNTGNYKKALSIFYNINSESRDNYLYSESVYAIIACHIALENWDEAERSLSSLTSDYPGYKDSDKTKVTKAIIAFGQEHYQEVIELLKDIETQEALFYKAKAYFFTNDPRNSLAAFKKITGEYPESDLARYSFYYMGDVLFFSGNYSGALYKYVEFLEKYPYSELKEYASYKLAVCYYNEDNYLKTVECLKPILNSRDIFLAAHSNFLYGKCLKKLGRGEEALNTFTKIVSNFPELKVASLANIEMGQVFLGMGDTVQARVVYQQMSSKYSSGETIGLGDYLAGGLAFTEGNYLTTKKHLSKILRYYWGSDITCPTVALLLRTYNKTKDYSLTVALGEALLSKDACEKNNIWNGRAMFDLAEAYYQTGQYENAKRLFQEIISDYQYSDPELLAASQASYGWCLLHENRLDITEDQFTKVMSAYSMDTTSLMNSFFGNGITLFNKGEYEKALNFFESISKFPEEHPLKPRGIFYTGKAYYNLEYYRQAIESWERILQSYPNSSIAPDAAYEIGITYFQALKYEMAAPYFKMVIDEYPNSPLVPQAMIALGNNYYNGEDYERAIDAFSKFVSVYPGDSLIDEVEQSLSSAYYMAGQKNPNILKDFIEQFPSDPKAALSQFNLAVRFYEEEDKDKALETFRKVVIDFPDAEYAEDAQVNIIKIYDEKKDYENLVGEANLFLDYFPESERVPLALFYGGSGYFYLGNYGKAIEAFKKILNDYPNSEYVSTATHNINQCYKRLGSAERIGGGQTE